jgi:hypothetical protein
MAKVRQLSVAQQVMLIFGLICAILVAIGVFLFFGLRTIEQHTKEIQTQILQEWKVSLDLSRNLWLEQIEILRHVQTQDGEEMKRREQTISNLKEADARRWSDYGKLIDDKTEMQLYASASQAQKE